MATQAPRKTTTKPAADKKPAATKTSSSRALANWEEQLAQQAEVAAGMEESSGGGKFFGLKGGILSWNDAPMPDNQMAVVILDHIFETVYYEGEYDPENPASPTAYAFGRDEKKLVWHENSDPSFAGQLCADSDVCQWGSADKGRGKAAKETRRLAMIPAGHWVNGRFELLEDEDHYINATAGFMRLPVMSVNGWGSYVKTIAGTLRRPPHGMVTKVKVIPDPKSQFRVTFEPVQQVPNELMTAIMERHEAMKSVIDFPYPTFEEQAETKAKKVVNKAKTSSRTPPGRGAVTKRVGGRKY
jgi:hypothetical protein